MTPAAAAKQQSTETTPAPPTAPTATKNLIVERTATARSISPVTTKEPPSGGDEASRPLLRPTAAAATASLQVVHLHRFGNCRGRLAVSRDGVAFVSEGKDGDAFTFKFTEFLHAMSDDTLTLRSATETYRFRAAGSADGSTSKLRELADRISRARR